MPISPKIKKIQTKLLADVKNDERVICSLKWKTGEKIRFFSKKLDMMETILKLQMNYSNYYNQDYEIESFKICEVINKNKINFF